MWFVPGSGGHVVCAREWWPCGCWYGCMLSLSSRAELLDLGGGRGVDGENVPLVIL